MLYKINSLLHDVIRMSILWLGGEYVQVSNNGIFRFQAICYSCRREFYVNEGTKAYDNVKQNLHGLHCCEDCKARIELEARLSLGRKWLGDK